MHACGLLLGAVLPIPILRYVDWMAIMVFAHPPAFELIETIIATMANVFFCGVLGIVFAYMMPLIKREKIYLKGWVFSLVVWIGAYTITTILKVDGTMPTSVETTILNISGATVYGFTLAYATNKLIYGEMKSSPVTNLAPAMKPMEDREEKEK